MLNRAVPKLESTLSISDLVNSFENDQEIKTVIKLYAWVSGSNNDVYTIRNLPFSDNSLLFLPEEFSKEPMSLFEVDIVIQHPLLLVDQLETKDILQGNVMSTKFILDLISKGYDSIIVTEHSIRGRNNNFLILLNSELSVIRSKLIGTFGNETIEPNITDLEQDDATRIKQERDMLAEAIGDMGIKLGHIRPDALLTGPHLIQICRDVVEINKLVQEKEPQSVFDLIDNLKASLTRQMGVPKHFL